MGLFVLSVGFFRRGVVAVEIDGSGEFGSARGGGVRGLGTRGEEVGDEFVVGVQQLPAVL